MAELIVALDVRSPAQAMELVQALPDLRWVKIGPILYLRDGPALIGELKDRGLRVFLDLKWHDIPSTVAEAVAAAEERGIDLATVHALGGRAMLEAAVGAAGAMRLAAVSVLTSHGPTGYWEALGGGAGGELSAEVVRLARLAVDAGVQALVASAREVGVVRMAVGPQHWIVTPGIRPAGVGWDDHHRAADPATAVAAGATHLVVGRPILRAKDPRQVYESLCEAVA